jgi:ERI1 exoribonuclease 3
MSFIKPYKTHILVLDFEANCSADQVRDHEIIEFPAVLVNLQNGDIQSEFRTFVKMKHHAHLSDFIKDLTHITDEDLSGGKTWVESLIAFEEWCFNNEVTPENTTIVCCGDWDLKTMLPRQMKLHQTRFTPFVNELFSVWNNIKTTYMHAMRKRKRVGMAAMLEELKIPLTGHHHSGIDDCRNIAKICLYLYKGGVDVTEPNNLRGETLWYETYSDLVYKKTLLGHIEKRK